MNDRSSAVVIGAGISGLCTAFWLRQKGFRVTVEKELSSGGRVDVALSMEGKMIA